MLKNVDTPSAPPGRRLQVRPFAPALGAEVRGVDLARGMDEDTYREIRSALLSFGVLFFKRQSEMPPAVQVEIRFRWQQRLSARDAA